MKTNIFPTTLKTVSLAALLTVNAMPLKAVSLSVEQCASICKAGHDTAYALCTGRDYFLSADECTNMLTSATRACMESCPYVGSSAKKTTE